LSQVFTTERDRPEIPLLLAILGGVFVVVEGGLQLGAAASANVAGLHPVSGNLALVGVASIILGLLLITFGGIVGTNPIHKRLAGTTLIGLSMISLLFGGGFLIGFALGLVAGVLAFTWTPAPPFYVAPEGWAMCPKCGSAVEVGSRVCPECLTGLVFSVGREVEETPAEKPPTERSDQSNNH
jgi:hypothetical protein